MRYRFLTVIIIQMKPAGSRAIFRPRLTGVFCLVAIIVLETEDNCLGLKRKKER